LLDVIRTPTRTRPKTGPKKTRRRVNARRTGNARPRPAAVSPAEPDTSAAPVTSASKRKELRALAHHLQPLVHVGHSGVQPPVVEAVSRALRDHELIKVRLHEPQDKQSMAEELATQTRAALCGLVGHTVILYKPKPQAVPMRSARTTPPERSSRSKTP
jgi:RNA-binding protein